jgi:2-succinyl-6-hydroxy-2,4-cyclohexadiene-1-carboxylate synthase
VPNNVQVNYHTWGNQQNSHLLLLHGFMGCAADWDTVAQALSADFYCIAPDLPGHGGSQIDSEKHSSFENYADSVIELMDSLDCKPLSAIGYSMGGRLLLSLALRHPNRFKKLILESASPGIADRDKRRQRQHSDAALAIRLKETTFSSFLNNWYSQPLFGAIDSAQGYTSMRQRRLQNSADSLATALSHAGTGQQSPLWDQLPELQPSTLLIYGEHDSKYKEVTAQMLARNDQFETLSLPNCSHAAHVESPIEFIEICKSFLVTGVGNL